MARTTFEKQLGAIGGHLAGKLAAFCAPLPFFTFGRYESIAFCLTSLQISSAQAHHHAAMYPLMYQFYFRSFPPFFILWSQARSRKSGN
jgi:hypothetical protein